MPEPRYRFGSYLFQTDTGDLLLSSEDGFELHKQLAPQPTRLLRLLLENYPDLVSHGQIKDHIWPEVQVDFDRSLHFCIRQIRAALDENASKPTFIETVPRKGYRWMQQPELVDPSEAIDAGREGSLHTQSEDIGSRKISAWIPAAAVLVALAGILLLGSNILTPNNDPTALRVGIMPLQPTANRHHFYNNDIAFQLMDELGPYISENLEIIGPTSTEKYASTDLRNLNKELNLDWIINAKFSLRGDTSKILAEIIRTSDGSHSWVKYFDQSASTDLIVDQIAGGFMEESGLELEGDQ